MYRERGVNSSRGGAEHLARIHGTEEDKVGSTIFAHLTSVSLDTAFNPAERKLAAQQLIYFSTLLPAFLPPSYPPLLTNPLPSPPD